MINKEKSLTHMLAYRLALDAIINNKDIKNDLHTSYQGGFSADGQDFGFVFAKKCVDIATSLIVNDQNNLENVSEKLFKTISLLNDSHFAFAVDLLKTNLIKQVPEFINEQNQLKDDVKQKVANSAVSLTNVKNFYFKKATI